MPAPTHDYDALPTDLRAPTFRQELRVVAVVLVFIAVLEVAARFVAPALDYDRRHIHALPEIVTNLAQRAKASGHPRVVFFGNSLMMHGLDEGIFHDELQRLNAPPMETTKITPVGTAMLDWVYLYQRYFATPESQPDVLVVGFVAHHIHDQEPIKIRRLSRHFVAPQNFPAVWRTDLHGFHEIVQSALCGISALEGDQPEHQLILLNACVADYQTGVKANNRLVESATVRKSLQNVIAPTETFQRMGRFIQLCKSNGVKIFFVPMPQPEKWEVNPEAIRLTQAHAMGFLDARAIDGMTEADFSDGYHLGETGKEKFSRWLARALSTQSLR
ncbi:MAG: hypothetical protein KDK97_18345 [Verrucomicrobiales bacterium]|nr:hypothetical protein [Verrucomicrobiales bacterium]MCP5557319.1 hypothetical protein [Verrucomicrobiaceae bacterium]